jgi:hypothetical protein
MGREGRSEAKARVGRRPLKTRAGQLHAGKVYLSRWSIRHPSGDGSGVSSGLSTDDVCTGVARGSRWIGRILPQTATFSSSSLLGRDVGAMLSSSPPSLVMDVYLLCLHGCRCSVSISGLSTLADGLMPPRNTTPLLRSDPHPGSFADPPHRERRKRRCPAHSYAIALQQRGGMEALTSCLTPPRCNRSRCRTGRTIAARRRRCVPAD